MVFAEPVPNFGIVSVNIVFDRKPNITNRLPIDFNGQVVGLLIRFIGPYPRLSIAGRVGIGKKITNLVPDMPIVGMPNQRFFIAFSPGTQLAYRKWKTDQCSSQDKQ